MSESQNNKKVNDWLLANLPTLLKKWFPDGKFINAKNKFVLGGLNTDGKGDSMTVSLDSKGLWKDHATGESGNPLMLYAHKNTCGDTKKAFKSILDTINGGVSSEETFDVAPEGTKPPSFFFKDAVDIYQYKNTKGQLCFYICKFIVEGKKQFKHFSFSKEKNGWVKKGWKYNRPLYGAELITLEENKHKDVLIVEGEKCVNAARKMLNDKALIVTSSNGSCSVNKSDWTPLFGRKKIIIWPDKDSQGYKYKNRVVDKLIDKCESIYFLDVQNLEKKKSWDCADAMKEKANLKDIFNICPLIKCLKVNEVTKAIDKGEEVDKKKVEIHLASEYQSSKKIDIYNLNNWRKWGISYNERNMIPDNNQWNIGIMLRNDDALKGNIWHDEFYDRTMTNLEPTEDMSVKPSEKAHKWDDDDNAIVIDHLQGHRGFQYISGEKIDGALKSFSRRKENRKNEVKTFFDKIGEDEKIRNISDDEFGAWWSIWYGEKNNHYTQSVSYYFFLSLMGRVYEKNAEVDSIVVLLGSSGTGKTKSLKAIAQNKWAGIPHSKVNNKEIYTDCRGKWLIIFDEMKNIKGCSEDDVKAFLSTSEMAYTPKYSNYEKMMTKHYIAVATENDKDFLNSCAGNRRYLPIEVHKIKDINLFQNGVLPFFKKAVNIYKMGGEKAKWWKKINPDKLEKLQKNFVKDDPVRDIVKKYLDNEDGLDELPNPLKISNIIDSVPEFRALSAESKLDINNNKLKKKIIQALQFLGYENATIRIDDKVCRTWRKRK